MNAGRFFQAGTLLFMVVGVVALISLSGCETSDGTESPVEVTPDTVSLPGGVGDTVVLQASGGLAPFAWAVSDATLGAVSASGEVAVYTRTAASGINIVTATDTNGYAGRAMIYQDTTP